MLLLLLQKKKPFSLLDFVLNIKKPKYSEKASPFFIYNNGQRKYTFSKYKKMWITMFCNFLLFFFFMQKLRMCSFEHVKTFFKSIQLYFIPILEYELFINFNYFKYYLNIKVRKKSNPFPKSLLKVIQFTFIKT